MNRKDPLEATSVKSRRISAIEGMPIDTEPMWVRPQPIIKLPKRETEPRSNVFDIAKKLASERNEDRNAAVEDAYQRGFDEGYATAEREWQERSATIARRFESYALQIDQAVSSIYRELVDPMTELSLLIAKRACATELQITPEIVAKLIWNVCKEIGDRSELNILINPDDLVAMQEAGVDILSGVAATSKIKITPAKGMTRGGCIVETPQGTWDARWETRWNELVNTMLQRGSTLSERIDA